MSQLPMYPPQQHDVVGPDAQGTPTGKITRPWLAYLQSLTTNVVNSVTHTGALVLNRLIVGNGGNDIRAVAGQDGQVPIAATSDGTVQFQNIVGTLPVVVTNSPHGIAISAPTATTGAASPVKSVQYNKAGAFAGSAEFTFDDTKQQVAITADTNFSQLVIQNATPTTGLVAVNPRTVHYEDITLGYQLDSAGDYIPNDTDGAYFWRSDDTAGVEVNDGLTPGTAVPFTSGMDLFATGPIRSADPAAGIASAYGLTAGAVPGTTLFATRNDASSGAASTVGGEQRSGTRWYVWQDATGAMRYGPARPTEDNSVSDTSGSLFGSGSGTTPAQVAARVMIGI